MAYNAPTNNRPSRSAPDPAEAAREAEQEQWRQDWHQHNRVLQSDISPLERWEHICNNVSKVAMCDQLVEHCRRVGLEIEKPKLDWTALKEMCSKIGHDAPKNEEGKNK